MTSGRVPRDGAPMRTQARIAWALLGVDALAFVAICKYVDFDGRGTLWGMAVIGAPMVGAIGLFTWGVASSINAGIFARLASGERVIASWIVDADTWRERMAARRALGFDSPFDMPDKLPPPGGTEVVVATGGIFVGRRYVHPLFPGAGTGIEIRQGWLDIEVDAEGGLMHLRLAIGGDPHAHAAAGKVVRHFRGPDGRLPSGAPSSGR